MLLASLSRGHRQYAELIDAAGNIVERRMLDGASDVFETSMTSARAGWRKGFYVVGLGIEHIATGYDHLLFLLALLVVEVSWAASLRIITSFTVAHSLTLALAAYGRLALPSGWVEPLIALSIVYVGLENLRARRTRRWILTFLFGLVHGLGFASALEALGVGAGTTSGIAVPLRSFNLGVELGQLTIALVALPSIYVLRRRFDGYSAASSLSIAIALSGSYWFVTRTFG